MKQVFRALQLAFVPLGGGSCGKQNQTSLCCLGHERPSQKIELVISCQSSNNSKGAWGAFTPWPSRLLARPGRPRAEENLLISPPSTRRCGFLFLLLEILFGVDPRRPSTPQACAPRRGSPGSRFLSASSGHTPAPPQHSVPSPPCQPRSARSADACCAASKEGCA